MWSLERLIMYGLERGGGGWRWLCPSKAGVIKILFSLSKMLPTQSTFYQWPNAILFLPMMIIFQPNQNCKRVLQKHSAPHHHPYFQESQMVGPLVLLKQLNVETFFRYVIFDTGTCKLWFNKLRILSSKKITILINDQTKKISKIR